MALSDVQPSSWYENWQNAAPSLGWQYREYGDDRDYSRWVLPGGGEEGSLRTLSFDDYGQPIGIDTQKAYRQDLAKQGYVPFSSLDEIQGIAQVAKDAYGRPFYGDVNAFLNYGFGPGTQILQDPTHGFLVKAGDPQKALEPSAVIYPQRQSDGSFLDTVFDFVGNTGPAIIPSLLVPGGQFMAFKTGLGSLADYVVKGALQGALRGGDLEQIIQGGLLGGASGEFASAISPAVKDALGSIGITDPTAVRAAVSSVTSGVREAVFGEGDPLGSALKTGLNTYLPQVAAELLPAPVEEAKYSPTEQTTADYSQGYPQLAGLDTGTTTDVTAGTTGQIQETPEDVLRIEEPQAGQSDESDVYSSGQKIKYTLTSLISFGQSQGIPIDGPNLAALGASVFGGQSPTGTPQFSIVTFGGNFFIKDLTTNLSYGLLHIGDSFVLQNPETNIQIQLDPQESQVLQNVFQSAQDSNLIKSGSEQDVSSNTETPSLGDYVSGEELPTGGIPSETQETYVDTTTTPSAETRGEPAPVPLTPAEPVLTSETGTYDFGQPLTPSFDTTTPAVPGSPTAQDTTYGTVGQAFEPSAMLSGPSETTAYTPGTPSNIPGISGVPDTLGIPGVYGEPSGPSGPSVPSGPGGPAQPEETTATMPVPEPAETFQPTPDEGEPIEEPLASSGGISTSSVGRYTTPARRTGTSPVSTAYLARGIVGSPEITGSPVFGTEKGKRRKVWNIESLREALGI